ncbi:phage tail protein [Tsukamurella paurometabola]|uniref:Tape measure protein n=1 Tax=Tsukamurella paurometabola TaxID=2061 RepID=A0ABS5NJ86_TSUPA|nr:hypothetical protein [Tsukamurella paurometabola]MBS4103968.1 hypothetical protein [Tsukamurella paurometabola]
MAAAGATVGRVSIKVTPDTDGFRQSLRRQIEAAKRGLGTGAEVDIKVNLDHASAVSEFRALLAYMRAQGRIGVDIIGRFRTENNNNNGFGNGGDIGILSKIKAGPWLTIGKVIAGLAVLAPVITTLAGALTTIPGLVAAIGIPVAALALGLDGLKKAAESIKGPFESLKKVMSDRAEKAFTPVFQELVPLINNLKLSLPKVTDSLALMFRTFTRSFTSTEGMAKLNGMIDNIALAIQRAAPGIGFFTDGLLNLAAAFSNQLPNISAWFNDMGLNFKFFIEQLRNSGQLDQIFTNLGTVIKSIVQDISIVLSGLVTAFSNPQFAQMLKDQFTLIIGGAQALITTSMGLTQALAALAGAINSAVQAFKDWDAAITGLPEKIQAVYNALNPFSGIGDKLRTAFSGFGEIGNGAMSELVTSFTTGKINVLGVISGLGSEIISKLSSIDLSSVGANIVQGLINGIRSRIGGAIAAAASLASQVAAAAKGALGIHSPSKVFEQIGIFTGLGMGIGMKKGFTPVLAQAQALAKQVADAVAKGADADKVIGAMNKTDVAGAQKSLEAESDRLSDQLKALQYQQKMAGNESLKSEIERLQKLKEQIDAQKEMVSLAGDYNKESTAGTDEDPLVKAASRLLKTPLDFGQAVGKQFMSDIGISGDGLIPNLLTQGLEFAQGVTFNVNSVDEALSANSVLQNKKALQFLSR